MEDETEDDSNWGNPSSTNGDSSRSLLIAEEARGVDLMVFKEDLLVLLSLAKKLCQSADSIARSSSASFFVGKEIDESRNAKDAVLFSLSLSLSFFLYNLSTY